MSKSKYTREILEPLVERNLSVAGVMRDLGMNVLQGGIHTHISKAIKRLRLDTRHFTGKATNCGKSHAGGPAKKSAKEVLILRSNGKRQKAYQLRRALIEIGRPYRCEICGINGVWQNKTLMLEIEHVNNNFLDDRIKNLKFLCPNCHSQTSGYCGEKGFVEVDSIAKYSKDYRRRKRGSGGMAYALRLERNGQKL